MAAMTEYTPGVCNIGPAEIRVRRRFGIVASVAALALWIALAVLNVPAPWRLLVFFPAAMGATGFLQAAMHFCAGFGSRGLFNFGNEIGKTRSVEEEEFRSKDRRKAREIGLYSALAGLAVAVAAFLIPFASSIP